MIGALCSISCPLGVLLYAAPTSAPGTMQQSSAIATHALSARIVDATKSRESEFADPETPPEAPRIALLDV
jgi:hypothetical protein